MVQSFPMAATMGLAQPLLASAIGNLTLTLYDQKNEKLISYTFNVSPSEIQIEIPSRMNVYQTLNGSSYVDHIGAGLTQIIFNGMIGPNPMLGAIGWVQFSLLRKIVDEYYKRCKDGMAQNTKLRLSISFRDSPNFGCWDVSVKGLALRRNNSKPMMHQYTLSMIALSEDLFSTERDVRMILMNPIEDENGIVNYEAGNPLGGVNRLVRDWNIIGKTTSLPLNEDTLMTVSQSQLDLLKINSEPLKYYMLKIIVSDNVTSVASLIKTVYFDSGKRKPAEDEESNLTETENLVAKVFEDSWLDSSLYNKSSLLPYGTELYFDMQDIST